MKTSAVAAITLLASACAVLAADSSFRAVVFESGENMHISEGNGNPTKPLVRVAPRIDHEFSLGPGSIHDLSVLAAESGVTLAPGEQVLYSPRPRLVFAQGRPEMLEMVQTLFAGHSHEAAQYVFEISEESVDGTRRSLSSGDIASGSELEIARQGKAFTLGIVAGPEGDADIEIAGKLVTSSGPLDISSKVIGKIGEDALLLDKKDSGKAALEIIIHLETKGVGRDVKKMQAIACRMAKELADYKTPPEVKGDPSK